MLCHFYAVSVEWFYLHFFSRYQYCIWNHGLILLLIQLDISAHCIKQQSVQEHYQRQVSICFSILHTSGSQVVVWWVMSYEWLWMIPNDTNEIEKFRYS